jgi:hypothetical protein
MRQALVALANKFAAQALRRDRAHPSCPNPIVFVAFTQSAMNR